MGIVNSEIKINHSDGDVRFVREIHTDNLGVDHPYEYAPALDITQVELDDNLAAHALIVGDRLGEQEIQQWISEINQGRDPAHIDMGGYFVHSEPNFNTWEVATDGAVTPFLQTASPEQTPALINVSLLWGRLTNKEGEAIAGKPNDVSSEIQIAINTQTINDEYIPLIDEGGNPRA